MAIIGTFTRTENEFIGTIKTLTVSAKVRLVPVEKTSDKSPEYRVYAFGGAELGAAWPQVSNDGVPYHSLTLDDPSFARPIYASLMHSEDEADQFNLLWSRPRAN
ncbi:DUF736 domain-containing protein [Methylovirgula sp. 4M-Z18]|uniref:DUF736 domain-containing protein n=1 Tax=Methylovirgula sp. 4M-Z18 TaxID=2293567 RepID=UPI000E2FCF56|nr:DUF736 domain-containing protein [Methylovirgula sp. 4M-Z18]RFB76646.1 DUF736 domain-containing protein [Methylovirgula sp. 4M-Z18]